MWLRRNLKVSLRRNKPLHGMLSRSPRALHLTILATFFSPLSLQNVDNVHS